MEDIHASITEEILKKIRLANSLTDLMEVNNLLGDLTTVFTEKEWQYIMKVFTAKIDMFE